MIGTTKTVSVRAGNTPVFEVGLTTELSRERSDPVKRFCYLDFIKK
jgi:hypothetical protein